MSASHSSRTLLQWSKIRQPSKWIGQSVMFTTWIQQFKLQYLMLHNHSSQAYAYLISRPKMTLYPESNNSDTHILMYTLRECAHTAPTIFNKEPTHLYTDIMRGEGTGLEIWKRILLTTDGRGCGKVQVQVYLDYGILQTCHF